MNEKVTATELKFDIPIQMTLEHVLARRLKQSTLWTAEVSNINKYVPN